MAQIGLDIVTTLREPLPLTLAFVAHHLDQGVRALHLYFDDPDDPAIDVVAHLPRLRITRCDDRHWRRWGGRPTMIVARQVANAQDCQAQARSPWLLHCDADEFLIRARYVIGLLAANDARIDVLRLPVWERCFAPHDDPVALFGGHCRGPVMAPATVYGAAAAHLNRGMAAYAGCKSITRVAAGLTIGIHDSAAPTPQGGSARVRRMTLARAQMVHVDGLTPAHAAQKLIHRGVEIPDVRRKDIMSPSRSAQIAGLTDPTTDIDAHFRALRHLSRDQFAALQDIDAIMPMPVAPGAAAMRHWPQVAPLYRKDAFDRIMQTQLAGGWRRSA